MEDIKGILSKSKNLKILYVEDDDVLLSNASELFREFFLRVDEAVDGVDGFDKYEEFYKETGSYYDIVITDINMPRLNGLDMIAKIKKIKDEQVCVTVSAYSDLEFLQKSIELGVDSYIVKPISYKYFIKVLINVVEKVDNRIKIKEYQSKLEELLVEQTQLSRIAQEQSKQKSKFLASMSHEIRNPLTAILGYLDLLRDMETDRQKSEYLNVIDYSSKSLLGLVNDILDLSKIEENKLDMVYKDFDSYYEFDNIAKLFVARADDKRVYFNTNISNSIPKVLNSDILRIKQIISNLLSNAIKFTSTKIDFSISYKENQLIIVVEDDGIGMSDEVQSRIFKEYEQATDTTSYTYGGTGLGLSITLKLTQMLGGEITLKSEVDKFSRFEVVIPIEIGDEANIVKQLDKNYEFSGHILLAEDNMINQKLVQRLLLNMNLTCDCADNGSEAYDMFTKEDYDLVLMDVNMPLMGGKEATKKIRKFEQKEGISEVPIISFSANARNEDIQEYIKIGMNDYVAKPILKNKINEVFKKYLPFNEIKNSEEVQIDSDISIKNLSQILGFDEDEIIEMLNELVDTSIEQLIVMKKAYKDKDTKSIYQSAHFIKGSAYAMRINNLGDITQDLEKFARENNLESINESLKLFDSAVCNLKNNIAKI